MKRFLLSAVALTGMAATVLAGTGIKSDPYTVEEILGMEAPATPEAGVYVKGYIVGSIATTDTDFGMNTNTCVFGPNTVKTNIILADASAETDLDYLMPVKIPAGTLRDELSVGGNPAVLGHEVIICGSWTKGFGKPCIADVTSYEWVGEAPAGPSTGDYATGSAEKPLTVTELLAQGKPSAAVKGTYVTGYIVGFVPEMTWSEAVFGAENAVNTNIVMAASATETAIANCIPVQLPAAVREAISLKDNPTNLGRQITILGSHEAYFGQNGMKNISAYAFDGDVISGGDTPVGPGDQETGSASNPLGVDQFIAFGIPSAAVANTFVKGVIVGNAPGKNIDSAIFTATGASDSNILIAAVAGETNISKCIPVQLPQRELRSALNIKDHPENLGKTVVLCGSREKYFGVSGLKNIKSYAWEGSEMPEYFYEALVQNADGWTIDNVVMPEELTYIWTPWNAERSYAAGSAYKDNVAYAAEAYFISPVIDLTERENVIVSFEHAAKFQTTLREECGFAVREAGASEWNEIAITTWPEPGAWSFAKAGEFDFSAYDGKKIQVAFKYGSTDQGADTWEVKNLYFSGKKVSAVEVVEIEKDVVYVNGSDIVAPADARVFNINGVDTGRSNLSAGIYVVVTPRSAVKVVVR